MKQGNEEIYVPVNDLQVTSWSPGSEDENLPPTQVHVLYRVPKLQALFAIRLKSREVTDSFIAALVEQRDRVWGKSEAPK